MTTNPIYVALDTADVGLALTLARQVRGHVGGLKLGMEFFMANGPAGVARLADQGLPVFLDLKLHDISNTVGGGMRSLATLKPAIVNVHAAGGAKMMAAAREAMPPETRVIAVTVLTSLDDDDLRRIGIGDGAAAQVERLAALTRSAGLDGIVCSAHEVSARRAAWADGLFVVPGIRPAGADVGDQKRIMTPRDALDAGASVLVIGRPITAAADPAAAAAAITASLA